MNALRKNLIKVAPHILWTLFFSVPFAAISYYLNIHAFGMTNVSMQTEYYKGLLIFVPLALLSYFRHTTDELWKFIVKAVIMVVVSLIVTQSILFALVTAIFSYLRVSNNLDKEKSSFDGMSKVVVLYIFACFILSGFARGVFLQKMLVYHFLFAVILIFMHNGFVRFEEYVELKRDRSNVPDQRILENGTKIFVIISLAVIFLIVPMIRYQYDFITIGAEITDSEYEYELEETEEETEEGEIDGSDSFSVGDLENEGALAEFLMPMWDFLEPVLYYGSYVVYAYYIIKALIIFISNLKNPLVLKNDVIESTFVTVQDKTETTTPSVKFSEMFDFSREMNVRRRYKRALKKHAPKGWQTPTEMEQMANLEIPKLHDEYLNVRYGKSE